MTSMATQPGGGGIWTLVVAASLVAGTAGCDSSTTVPGSGGSGGGGGAVGTGGCVPGGGGDDVVCPQAVRVDSAAAMAAELPANWPFVGSHTSGALPITPDLEATADLTVQPEEIPLPADCTLPACAELGAFSMVGDVAGVTVQDGNLQIQGGSRLRLRAVLRDGHPGPYATMPAVTVYPSCDVPCLADERRCAADAVCYADGGYCARCEELEQQRCACYTFCGPLPDGTTCGYFISNDNGISGECQGGACW